ncbi:MAG: type II toxin-antitoxin system Phd/YefM family antitoxin [Lactobacillaceae bacterium]|nr:type II toxin-antitoxin system Phd/YefM family antitoxin [Lactobacillaceae bacterium]
MAIETTQSDFRKHVKSYLDQATDNNQTVLVTCSHQKTAAVISKNRLNALINAVTSKKNSLDYAIARDKLIDMHILSEDPLVEHNADYWNQFRNS